MTPQRKQEIRDRCDKATEGPWYTDEPDESGLTSIIDGRSDGLFTIYAETNEANFIAHARTDIPDLLDEIERLEKEAAEWKSAHYRQQQSAIVQDSKEMEAGFHAFD